ncbi:MAG: response regulator transcription factor, partial [Candidatus Latescibacteria bacterium]|nr:response regulator transcription factor [Candidatus Latescibacterota bacterium]
MSPKIGQHILVVEDEEDIAELVRYHLDRAGFRVRIALNGEDALREVKANRPALIVLDLMLPDIEGTEVCRRIRRVPETVGLPILMLTAKGEEMDRVVGFELGADDYMTKPFSPRELVLRVKAILRRSAGMRAGEEEQIRAGDLTVDVGAHRVSVQGTPVVLTATEFDLLVFLMRSPGKVHTRDGLLNAVWGHDYIGYDRTVDTHVRRLRKKLGAAAEHIETVRGVGYRFRISDCGMR